MIIWLIVAAVVLFTLRKPLTAVVLLIASMLVGGIMWMSAGLVILVYRTITKYPRSCIVLAGLIIAAVLGTQHG